MKRILLGLLIAATLAAAAEIQIVVRNDAGTVVSTVTLTTSNAALQALNQWRLAQTTPSVNPGDPPVLTYPTAASLWQRVIGGFVKSVVRPYLKAVADEQAKIDAAKVAQDAAVEGAIK
ncbi:MAG: hypothetical protein FJW34_00050 [Acidobacteria bacterium]|nr:hypothetical protein [Acidobacteriota bacterium]